MERKKRRIPPGLMLTGAVWPTVADDSDPPASESERRAQARRKTSRDANRRRPRDDR